MKAVVQRALSASLKVDGKLISEIEKGLVVFLGVGQGDNEEDLNKIWELRHYIPDPTKPILPPNKFSIR